MDHSPQFRRWNSHLAWLLRTRTGLPSLARSLAGLPLIMRGSLGALTRAMIRTGTLFTLCIGHILEPVLRLIAYGMSRPGSTVRLVRGGRGHTSTPSKNTPCAEETPTGHSPRTHCRPYPTLATGTQPPDSSPNRDPRASPHPAPSLSPPRQPRKGYPPRTD